jgi:uncharacterized protein
MGLIISNTSPILALANIGRLNLLQKQFNSILIPEGVKNELKLEENFSGAIDIKKAISEGWISVKNVQDKKYVSLLHRELDLGESECIALSQEMETEKIILDEKEARRIAKSMNLNVVGVIGILIRGVEEKDIADIEIELRALQSKIGFFISESLVQNIIHKINKS